MKSESCTTLAAHRHEPGDLRATLEFLKRTRSELRQLRLVRAWKERLCVLDVNNDAFEIVGLGYPDPEIVPLLDSVNAAYDPRTIHLPTDADHKEYKTGRCHPWAEDRVM